ncbi:MAG: tRNA lysidine(34) synthetase TilS, partial [Chloroflexia bacterium]
MDVAARFREFLNRHPALVQAERVGVAVSGGGDSVALACLAHEQWPGIVLLHMNYQLRGIESEADEALVRELAVSLKCGYLNQRVSPEGRSEEELRRLRYEWFDSCSVDVILTGHTRDDQAETVLFRLTRGTGSSGLGGVQPVLDRRIYRPLLEASRREVRDWLLEQKIAWREDSSNIDVTYRRNWIRHELLPLLRDHLNPEIGRALANLAEISRDEEEWIAPYVAGLLNSMTFAEGEGVVLDCGLLLKQPLGLKRRLMRGVIERVKGNLLEIDFAHVEAGLALTEELEGNGRIQIPGVDLMRSFGWLRVIPLSVLQSMPERNFRVDFSVPGQL